MDFKTKAALLVELLRLAVRVGGHPERDCGDCHACCVHLDFEGRKAHQRCDRLNDKGRCMTYDMRPNVCRDFLCLWRLGLTDEDARPDRCGVLAYVGLNEVHAVGVNVVECRPGAFQAGARFIADCEGLAVALVESVALDGSRRLVSYDPIWIADFRRRNRGKVDIPDDAIALKLEGDEHGGVTDLLYKRRRAKPARKEAKQ